VLVEFLDTQAGDADRATVACSSAGCSRVPPPAYRALTSESAA